MKLWHLIQESIYSPKFYASERSGSFRSADLYLLKLLSIFALVTTAISAPLFLTFIHSAEQSFEAHFASRIPEDFLLTIKDGVAMTNLPQPFIIPEKLIEVGSEDGRKSHAVVVDTRTAFSPEQFAARNAVFWVAKDGFVTQGDGKIEFTSYKEIETDVSINKEDVVRGSAFISKAGTFFRYFIVPSIFVLVLLYSILSNAIYLLFAALLLMGVGKLRGYSFAYSEAYRLSMYLLTLPLAIGFLLWVLGAQVLFVPTLVFVAVAWVNFPAVAAEKSAQ